MSLSILDFWCLCYSVLPPLSIQFVSIPFVFVFLSLWIIWFCALLLQSLVLLLLCMACTESYFVVAVMMIHLIPYYTSWVFFSSLASCVMTRSNRRQRLNCWLQKTLTGNRQCTTNSCLGNHRTNTLSHCSCVSLSHSHSHWLCSSRTYPT